jgi:hypothetical protein
VDRVRDQLNSIPDSSFSTLESPDPHVKMLFRHTKAEANGIGRATTVVDADMELCAAFDMNMMSRDLQKSFYANGGMEVSVRGPPPSPLPPSDLLVCCSVS